MKTTKIVPVFVGRNLPVSRRANPTPDMIVVELSSLDDLGEKLIGAVTDVSSKALPIMVRTELSDVFTERGLLFPDLMDSIESIRLANR